MSTKAKLLAFPANRRRDSELVDLLKRRIACERRALAGALADAQIVTEHGKPVTEALIIAKKYDI